MSPAHHSSPSSERVKGHLFASRAARALAVVGTVAIVIACGSGATSSSPPKASTAPIASSVAIATGSATPRMSASASHTIAPTATPAASPSAGPITVTGDDGQTITLASAPHKIVSLTPATSELIFALGDGAKLVGRTDYDDYPPEVANVPAVATFQGVEIEKVVDAAPDLVLAGGNGFTHQADIDQLRSLNIPVLVVYAQDVPGVLADINLVGQAIGSGDAANTMTDDIQARLDEVTTAVAALDKPRTFYEIGVDTAIYAPAPNSFVADMVTLAGGAPVTTSDPSQFSISLESLVTQDPQVIVLGDAQYGTCPDAVAGRAGWKRMTAVKDGAIRPVFDTIVTRPGPRIGDGLAALALAIHPEVQVTPPADVPLMCQGPAPS
jgi:iron complex transport system substrate-binding protein